ncbi:MAG: hypothetical protein RL272_32 [Candidatus Parcubacteria bacterium]
MVIITHPRTLMRNAEARNMQPESKSGPDSERKPRLIEGMVEETPESKTETAGDRFAADADAFNSLQERAVNKALELAKLEEGPLAANQDAKGALQKEMDSIQASVDAVADKYGEGTEDFVADALAKRDLEAQLAQKTARIKELNGIKESMNFPGGERGLSFEINYVTDQLGEILGKIDALKKGYDAKEAAAKKDLASISDSEIDAFVDGAIKENPFAGLKDEEIDGALSTLDEPILLTPEMQKKPKQSAEYTDAIHAVNSIDDLKVVINHMGAIEGTGGRTYSAEELMTKIDHAARFPVLLGEITRTNGLREKVGELIKAQRENEEAKRAFESEQRREKIEKMIEETLAEGGGGPTEIGDMPLAAGLEQRKEPTMSDADFDKALKALPDTSAAGKSRGAHDAKIDALAEKWFAEGEAMSEAHARGETPDEWTEVQDDWIVAAEAAPSKEEVADVVEKNELSPERRALVEKDIAVLKARIKELEEGVYTYEQGASESVQIRKDLAPGIKDVEAKLREQFGIDADTLMEKKALSPVESFKFGLKGLFNRDFKKTMKMYEDMTREWSEAKQELAENEMLLRDPQGYAERSARRLMRTLLVRANQAARAKPQSGSPFNMRF